MLYHLFKKGLSAIGMVFVMAVLTSCSQENLIFYPETLPADYKYRFSMPFEELSLNVDGGTINALHFKIPNSRGVVIYFHGNAGSLRTWGDVAGEFTSRGYNVLITDYRGFGKSRGKITGEELLLKDGRTVYEYAKNLYPEDRIILYGRSIGTGIAVHVAKHEKPALLILESPYFNLIDLANHHYPFIPRFLIASFLKYPIRTDLWIKDVSCPIYIFHGTADMVIPCDSSERLIKTCDGKVRLIRIEGAGHNDIGDSPLYQRTLSAILR
ncbi:MAG: hypothetical protein CSYNP_02430 [Syntrophus sp. SKADARSKE-3]|nr:hypothetical protein [Syntrophus sp. SKADARSKE-3]